MTLRWTHTRTYFFVERSGAELGASRNGSNVGLYDFSSRNWRNPVL
jgi:hypothetical protein